MCFQGADKPSKKRCRKENSPAAANAPDTPEYTSKKTVHMPDTPEWKKAVKEARRKVKLASDTKVCTLG